MCMYYSRIALSAAMNSHPSRALIRAQLTTRPRNMDNLHSFPHTDDNEDKNSVLLPRYAKFLLIAAYQDGVIGEYLNVLFVCMLCRVVLGQLLRMHI